MFGWSLSKLLALVALAAAVWYLFRMLAGPRVPRAREAPQARGPAQQGSRIEAEEMIACKICGTYVSATGARHCGRADCPWAR